MSSAAYLPFLYQIILAAGIAAAVIGASHFFGQRAKKNKIQDTTVTSMQLTLKLI